MDTKVSNEIPRAAAASDGAIETDAVIIGAGPVGLFQVFELGLLAHHPRHFRGGRHQHYPGKKKLILSGFHEAALAAFGAAK
jgi:hypothetical protein